MKVRVAAKDKQNVKDDAQDKLSSLLIDQSEAFMSKVSGLDDNDCNDIVIGALLTVASGHIAFVSVEEGTLDHELYLQSVFDAMSQLFQQHRKRLLEIKGQSDKLVDTKKDRAVH
jgi:hypothetical protein